VPKRITPTRDGRFRLRLPPEERAVLADLPGQLRELLDAGDPVVGRLFPPAYLDDPARSDEFDRLMRQDLLDRHRANLATLEATAAATVLDLEQLEAWLGALNGLRLTLGTTLDITEDTGLDGVPQDDPRFPVLSVYFYLGWLQENVVEALAAGVDPDGLPGAEPPPELRE
jgi:hypothetical protein